MYYTHLSNLLVLAYQLALGIAGHDPSCGVFRWLSAPVTALSVTLCIYVTHLLYAFVLIPAAKRSGDADWLRGRYSFANLCVHYVTPGLTVLQWLLSQQDRSHPPSCRLLAGAAAGLLCLRDAAGADGQPIGFSQKLYPYPFLDYPQLGAKPFWLYVSAILTFFFLLGCAFVWLAHRL